MVLKRMKPTLKKPYKTSMIIGPLREQMNLSQEDLAAGSELDRKHISNLENGKSQPTFKSIFKLARALQMRPSELVKHMEENLDEDEKYWKDKE
jgi:transcriptional regulator with XRE-family HTH domain